MELPSIAKRIGMIENKRKVYIEDYVVSFLERFKTEEIKEEERIVLYGKTHVSLSEESYVIFGAAKIQDNQTENINIFQELDEIGCLNLDIWQDTGSMCEGILIGDSMGGQPITGYYIFYEEQPLMGTYLSIYYEEEVKPKIHHHKNEKHGEIKAAPKKQAELVALSDDIMGGPFDESPIYSFIRAVVIIIFIIFCAIAVTTVNSFEKIQDFTNTAVYMNESINGNQLK